MGQYDDAISIFAAVTIVGTVAFVQEYRSEKSLAALNQLVPPHATVLRGGVASDIMARELVPGDVVLIGSGDRVPADCRIIQATELMTDDSSLTGEDHPHDKHADTLLPTNSNSSGSGGDLPLAECYNLVFMGSLACSGHCTAVVTATGMHTEFGKVSVKESYFNSLNLHELKAYTYTMRCGVGHCVVLQWRQHEQISAVHYVVFTDEQSLHVTAMQRVFCTVIKLHNRCYAHMHERASMVFSDLKAVEQRRTPLQ
eukprot:3901-Heterococcus_DN1.PRE.6